MSDDFSTGYREGKSGSGYSGTSPEYWAARAQGEAANKWEQDMKTVGGVDWSKASDSPSSPPKVDFSHIFQKLENPRFTILLGSSLFYIVVSIMGFMGGLSGIYNLLRSPSNRYTSADLTANWIGAVILTVGMAALFAHGCRSYKKDLAKLRAERLAERSSEK